MEQSRKYFCGMETGFSQGTITDYAHAGFPGSYDYASFRQMVRELLEQGKSTGPNQSEDLTEYSKLNEHRMNRWDKHFQPEQHVIDALSAYKGCTWLVITEGWCGDSAQTLPLIARLAHEAGISLRIILRDDNLWLMDQYLTNGGRSVPVLICLDEKGNEVFKWGPRPTKVQEVFLSMKNSTEPAYSYDQIKEAIHLLYARDKGQSLQEDFLRLVKSV
jgi:hypothetical protein